MKKIIFSFVIALMTIFSVNAQTAIETPKLFDNVYMGVQGGAFTPMDFNSVFPVNAAAGLKLGKQFTPVWGAEVEGNVFFNENNFYEWTKTFVKGTNVGVNGTVNLSNLLAGYKGSPRVFEVKTNTGLGWMHAWNAGKYNVLTAKTALDFDFNLGKNKAHTFSVSPGVFWMLNPIHKIQFNKQFAQLGVMAGYTYHFKTSNGTHAFKLYDVGAMNDEINNLRAELAKKPTEVVKKVTVIKKDVSVVENTYVVQFAKNSSLLTAENMRILDAIPEDVRVEVVGTASVEGSKEYNDKLSEARANAVTTYLKDRKVNVVSSRGIGSSNGPTSNRLVIVTIAK